MRTSIILCTWNNCQRLGITLDALTKLDPPHAEWEVIVVDNNSSDATKKIAHAYIDRLPLRYVFEGQQGLSRARNAGLAAASGEFIIFIDDDVTPAPQWLNTYVQAFAEYPEGYFFGGPVESDFESNDVDPELVRLGPWSVRGLDHGSIRRELKSGESFLSANWACSRQHIIDAGGFDTGRGLGANGTKKVSVGEETQLQQKLLTMGMKALYLPDARLKHFVPKDKCTLKHIAARAEASAYVSIPDNSRNTNVPAILGVPRWLVRRLCDQWFRTTVNSVFMRSNYEATLAYRTTLGCVRAHYDRSRNSASDTAVQNV